MNNEKELLYTKEHEWVKIEDNFAYVGITDHAQSELGDIIFVEFPQVGDKFISNDVFLINKSNVVFSSCFSKASILSSYFFLVKLKEDLV